jgi:NitT/TauT family transport system permease protein
LSETPILDRDQAAGAAATTPRARSTRRGRLDVREKPELVLIPAVFVVVVLGWEYGTRLFDVPAYILPPPSDIVATLSQQLQSPRYWTHVSVTAQETLYGFALGCGSAFLLGVAVSQIRLVEKTIYPYVVAFQTVPKIALAPLFVIWFGFGMTSKVVITALVCFFPMIVNVIEGLRAADQNQIEMMRSLDATRFQIFRKVQIPNALPFIFAGLDIGIIFAVIGAVVGEFVGARAGLGYLLLQYIYDFDTAGLFGALVTLSAMGLLGHFIVRYLQRRFAFWSDTGHTVAA